MFLTAMLLNFMLSSQSSDTILEKSYNGLKVLVTIQSATNAHYNLLVLPGYGYSDIEWCTKTTLCDKAKKLGFNLIFIEVQKSLYLKQYYPETKAAIKKYPTRTWKVDRVLNKLFDQKFNIVKKIEDIKPNIISNLYLTVNDEKIINDHVNDFFTLV